MKLFSKFQKDESGAVTVDWVVLAGVVIAFALAISEFVAPDLETALTNVGTDLVDATGGTGTTSP